LVLQALSVSTMHRYGGLNIQENCQISSLE
jgi:hypothetical protein